MSLNNEFISIRRRLVKVMNIPVYVNESVLGWCSRRGSTETFSIYTSRHLNRLLCVILFIVTIIIGRRSIIL